MTITTKKSLMRRVIDAIDVVRGRQIAAPNYLVEVTTGELGPEEVVKLLKEHPLAKSVPQLEDMANRIEVFSKGLSKAENGVVEANTIQVDSASLLVTLTQKGYEPLHIMALMARIYGSIMASAPDKVGEREDGSEITPDILQNEFFQACAHEREKYLKISKAIFGNSQNTLGKGTLH